MVICAQNGVPVAPVGSRFFAENAALLARYPGSRQVYFPDGAAVTKGAVELCRIRGAPRRRVSPMEEFPSRKLPFWLLALSASGGVAVPAPESAPHQGEQILALAQLEVGHAEQTRAEDEC
jgi:hypothetical protein